MKIKPRSSRNPQREPLFRCPFPNSGQVFAKQPGQPETCLKHRALIADVVYILNHTTRPEEEQGPAADQGPLIFVPKPGMADKAIQEALKGRGK